MLNALKPKPKLESSRARVVDGKLILSFPGALTPVVWQMDLGQAKSSALEVLEKPSDKTTQFTLTLKTQKGEKVDIALFDNKEEAITGLMAASSALENAHGNIQSPQLTHIASNQDQSHATTHIVSGMPARKGKKGWIIGILSILLLIVLFGYWGTIAPRSPMGYEQTSVSTNTSQPPPSAANSAGVPVSADEFLNGL